MSHRLISIVGLASFTLMIVTLLKSASHHWCLLLQCKHQNTCLIYLHQPPATTHLMKKAPLDNFSTCVFSLCCLQRQWRRTGHAVSSGCSLHILHITHAISHGCSVATKIRQSMHSHALFCHQYLRCLNTLRHNERNLIMPVEYSCR